MIKNERQTRVNNAIEEFTRALKQNKYVTGEMQFTDVTNVQYFLKAYSQDIRYCITWNKFLW